MYNLLTPLAHVHLSKRYTTMYRSLCIVGNGIQPTYFDQIRKLTETNDFRLSIHWRNLQILTVCALRMLGKILFVVVLPISGSCQSMVYWSLVWFVHFVVVFPKLYILIVDMGSRFIICFVVWHWNLWEI